MERREFRDGKGPVAGARVGNGGQRCHAERAVVGMAVTHITDSAACQGAGEPERGR